MSSSSYSADLRQRAIFLRLLGKGQASCLRPRFCSALPATYWQRDKSVARGKVCGQILSFFMFAKSVVASHDGTSLMVLSRIARAFSKA